MADDDLSPLEKYQKQFGMAPEAAPAAVAAPAPAAPQGEVAPLDKYMQQFGLKPPAPSEILDLQL